MAPGWEFPVERGDGASASAPRFVLLGELASGGMGSVDLVRMFDGSGEQVVAMKRMHPHYARDAEFIQMFRDEIRLTQSLRHHNVVQLVGWGEDDDGPYLVMEFVDGAPLAEIFYQGRRVGHEFPEALAAFVAARVADGLHAAHTLTDEQNRPLGLVHRDITPSNVLVGFDGSIKITDFGIAKAADRVSHTRTGILKGKLEYMSPEHALKRAVDGRSDLYSLGVVLFELLSGSPPFHGGSDLDVLKRVAYEPVPALDVLAPGVDAELATLISRLVAKRPEERPADGAEVARALDAWLATRGLVRGALEARLADHAVRYGAARRRRLRKLMNHEGMELGSSSSWRDPKRVGAPAPPAPGTFTRAVSVPSRAAPATGTRALAVPSSPVSAELPQLASSPIASPPIPSSPASASGMTRRVGVSVPATESASLPVAMAASPASTRVRWLPFALGGVVACVLVGVVFALTVRAGRAPEASVAEEPAAVAAPPPLTEIEAQEESPPATDPPAEPVSSMAPPTSSAEPPEVAPSAGQRRPRTTKVQTRKAPPSRSKPCTPDRFDYPACLGR